MVNEVYSASFPAFTQNSGKGKSLADVRTDTQSQDENPGVCEHTAQLASFLAAEYQFVHITTHAIINVLAIQLAQ